MPVSNRADTIADCIHGIFAASDHSGWSSALWIVVVADACTDATATKALQALGAFGEVLQVGVRSSRAAVLIGEDAVRDHFQRKPRDRLLLATADADQKVPLDWFAQLRRANKDELAARRRVLISQEAAEM